MRIWLYNFLTKAISNNEMVNKHVYLLNFFEEGESLTAGARCNAQPLFKVQLQQETSLRVTIHTDLY